MMKSANFFDKSTTERNKEASTVRAESARFQFHVPPIAVSKLSDCHGTLDQTQVFLPISPSQSELRLLSQDDVVQVIDSCWVTIERPTHWL